MYRWLSGNEEIQFESPFELIGRVSREWHSAVDRLEAEKIENLLNWEIFSKINYKNCILECIFRSMRRW